MTNRIDLQEARRRALLPNAVYDQVYDYALPSDFKAPINLNVQANNKYNGNQSRTYSNQFNNNKKDNSYAVVWEDMTQFLRFAKYLNAPLVIDKADSITENGTWTVSGNGSNLEIDTNNYMSGIGALKCDVSSPGSIVNVIMKIGNDNGNYYSKIVTTGHFEAFQTGWNLCRFDLSDATSIGTIDMANVSYISIIVTYNTNQIVTFEKTLTIPVDMSVDNYKSDGAVFAYLYFATVLSLTTLRLDNITAHIGTLYDINYYSNYVFRNTGGIWIDTPTSDNDIINLSSLSYRIFDAELSRIITQQKQGSMGGFDFNYWNLQLEGNQNQEGLYDQYERQFPSERQEGQTTYYNFNDDPFDLDNECHDGHDGMPGDQNITYNGSGFYVEN
jgi:hypothetical protein